MQQYFSCVLQKNADVKDWEGIYQNTITDFVGELDFFPLQFFCNTVILLL